MLTTVSGTVGGQLRQVSLYKESPEMLVVDSNLVGIEVKAEKTS